AARLAGSTGLHRAGRRSALYDRSPLLHGAGAASTDTPLALSLAQLHGDEHLDARDLRRALRHLLLPDAFHAGNDRLYRGRGRAGRHPRHALSGLCLASFRSTRRPNRVAAVHGRRPGDHGARGSLVRAHARDQHTLAPRTAEPWHIPTAALV